MRQLELPEELTASEYDIWINGIAVGKSDSEIAAYRNTKVKTVQNQVSNILHKLGAASRTEAAFIAYRNGLIKES
jgi:DNA-binding NarL/FixJ family response regulator